MYLSGAFDFFLIEPPAREWLLHIEPRFLCVDGQRPCPAALQAFTVRDTWRVLEPQITAPEPCGSQTRESMGVSFLER